MAESEDVKNMIDALTTALQGLSVQKTPPPAKLTKFRGRPSSPAEPSLKEWLDDFASFATHYHLTGEAKARALLEHLGGAAKEEVQCQKEEIRKDFGKIVEVLQSLFAPRDSLASLTQALHNRTQREGENLADFSRALMQLHNKMIITASPDEKAALENLKENTLKECFVKGTREKWVQRELRRIQMGDKKASFAEMRAEALELFGSDETGRRPRVSEAEVGVTTPQTGYPQTRRGG